jgi:hypothetical protein
MTFCDVASVKIVLSFLSGARQKQPTTIRSHQDGSDARNFKSIFTLLLFGGAAMKWYMTL